MMMRMDTHHTPDDEQAILEERLRLRTFELQVLYDLSAQIGYTLNYPDLIRVILQHLNRAVPHAIAASIVVTSEPYELFIQHTCPITPTVQEQARHHIITTLHRLGVKQVRTERLHNHISEQSDTSIDAAPVHELRSFFQVPLFIGKSGTVVGLIFVGAQQQDAFNEDHVRLLYTVANHASVAIERLKSMLASEQQRLESLVKHLSDGVLLLNAHQRIILANPVGREFLALLAGMSVGDVLTHLADQPLDALLNPPPESEMWYEVSSDDDTHPPRFFEIVPRPIENGPEAGGWTLFIRDVTERRQAQEDLKAYAARLEQSNRDLEQYAFVASHDLQEPLNMIVSFLKLLQKHYSDKLDDQANEFIGYAVDGSLRMRQLISDLLDYSRVEKRGKAFTTVSCEAVLQRALRYLKLPIEEHDVLITYDPLPTVIADESQLEQVFRNLISNAIKFRKEVPPRIHISAQPHDTQWRFAVCDNGIGIDLAYAELIFGIFKRLHTHDKYPGSGIGLSICQRIVERHHGHIWVESQPGAGSTFYFTLPIPHDLAATMPAEVSPPEPQAEPAAVQHAAAASE
jgi:signal transduction histidine kinase